MTDRRRKGLRRLLGLVILGVVVRLLVSFVVDVEYAYVPAPGQVLNRPPGLPMPAFDLWGRSVSAGEAAALRRTPPGRAPLSPGAGAVRIDAAELRLGRKAFYGQTFGNEVFLTDVMGILHGPLTLSGFSRALFALHGRGTTNLRVPLAKTAAIGGKVFHKGELVDTGLDVPRGAYVPLGMKIRFTRSHFLVGITCAACHSTVDARTGRVIDGAPNSDLNAGLLVAMARNSAAYFTHTDMKALQHVPRDPGRTVTTSDGRTAPLPNPRAMEDAVDAALLKWPPGCFDSTVDMVSDPTQLPVSWTRGNHPYSWSGVFAAGPFKGLSAQNNNVHALNADSLVQADQSPALFGTDREVYLGIILQNAASLLYRFDPKKGRKPSAFFRSVEPNPEAPGVNQVVVPPTFPKATLLTPDGTFVSTPGRRVWEEINAISAWQDTLLPPPPLREDDRPTLARGRAVFQRAGCASCHAGPFGSNHRVIPVAVIGTEPARARAFAKTERILGPPVIFAFDTPVPVPQGARTLTVPAGTLDAEQIRLAWARGGSPGGYKVPALTGLFWTAPYLHDGGVAAGPSLETELGLPGTVLRGIAPDPANSLKALLDRALREKVVGANRASADLEAMHIQGAGHSFWVDAPAGFTPADQAAVIGYLLSGFPSSLTHAGASGVTQASAVFKPLHPGNGSVQ